MQELGFCGDDCNCCPRYIATQSGDADRLKELAAIWKTLGWQDTIVPPEEMVCHGCASVNWCIYEIRECALQKEVDNCGKCENYPCEKVLKAFKRTESYAEDCKERLSKENYECFQKAFFSKKENLDRANKEFCSRIMEKSPN